MRLLLTFGAIVLASGAINAGAVEPVELHAMGPGTVSYSLVEKLAASYEKLHPEVKIRQEWSIERGEVGALCKQFIDFAHSDIAWDYNDKWTDNSVRQAKGGEIIQIPLAVGAIVPVYHLSDVPADKPLTFSGPVLADIFRGKITRWNDAAIAKLNAGVKLPDREITVIHRSDGCVTTFLYTDYLCSASADFAKDPGRGFSVNWPVENKEGASRSSAVLTLVERTNGGIGYVELPWARSRKCLYGNIINSRGKVIRASLNHLSAAAADLKELGPDLRMFSLHASGESSYPIAYFVYMLVYKNQTDANKGKALLDFLKWAVTEGQKIPPEFDFAPIPENVAKADVNLIDSIVVK